MKYVRNNSFVQRLSPSSSLLLLCYSSAAASSVAYYYYKNKYNFVEHHNRQHVDDDDSSLHFSPNSSFISKCDGSLPSSAKTSIINETKTNRLIFLGTGSSTGCPKPLCSMLFPTISKATKSNNKTEKKNEASPFCNVSNLAIQGDPKTNKNYRNNPSFLIQQWDEKSNVETKPKNIIIDVGKTFREGALRWFPMLGIQSLDAIVITHHHMDAAAGLDDVRNFQHLDTNQYKKTGKLKRIPTPLYLSQFCYRNLQAQFPWLLPTTRPATRTSTEKYDKESNVAVQRDVASFDVSIFQDFQAFHVQGLDIVPLPVWHGDDLISHGFAFSVGDTNVVYLSDISRMVPETLEFIKDKLPPTDILVVDALLLQGTNPVHFNLDQAMALRAQIQPRQNTFLVGMSCDSFLVSHDEMNQYLEQKYGSSVQLAHDGLVINV